MAAGGRAADFEGVTFHALRHSHVALLIEAVVNPKQIQARLGHSSIRTTLDTYGHLMVGYDDVAANALEDMFAFGDMDQMWTAGESNVLSLTSR